MRVYARAECDKPVSCRQFQRYKWVSLAASSFLKERIAVQVTSGEGSPVKKDI